MIFPAEKFDVTGRTIRVPRPVVPENSPFSRIIREKLAPFAAEDAEEIPFIFTTLDTLEEEAYILEIAPDRIAVTSSTERGAFYALQNLFRMAETRTLPIGTITAKPSVSMRGIKVYLPEPTERFIAEWKNMVDTLARYHMNTIMIELGGALEYKSHPEINEGWLEYAAFMNEYPGKANKIQSQFNWHKNSIHAANGRGKVISQELMRELIDYCRERYVEIIPEMPSLSHCDYLLTRHPELSERADDPYPDTCCPSNPAYYQLIFDLFDEVIGLFHPVRINIGHDEYYTIRICEKCKARTAPEIYATDIRKIRDHLAEKGVKTMLWGEKLLDSHFLDGVAIGGAERVQPNGDLLDATYPAIDMIPADVEILHWYWSIDRRFEEEYIKRDMDFTFGNFAPETMPEWKRRTEEKHCRGFIISNWGDADFRTLQRNCIWYQLAYAYMLSWNPAMNGECHREINEFVMNDLYSMRQNQLAAQGELITLKHTTDITMPYRVFVDGFFVDERNYLLGWHILENEAGKQYELPVIFGSNISNEKVTAVRRDDPHYICDQYLVSSQYEEVSAETLPEIDSDGITWYQCSYLHPEAGAKLKYIRFKPANAYAGKVRIKDLQGVKNDF